jgi:hypothetical protein
VVSPSNRPFWVAPSLHIAHLLARDPPGRRTSIRIGRALPAAVIAAALVAAGCGAEGNEHPTTGRRPASHVVPDSHTCPPAPRRLAAVLRQETRDGQRLQRLFAVRSNADFSRKAPAVREGVYFVSGNIGAAVFTWAVDAQARRTGTGLIVAADRQTRAVLPRRWVVSARDLDRRFGISPHTDGYARARGCANPTRA